MKYLLAACVLICVFASVSFAELAYVPLKDAVKDSDLIIVGTLINVSERKEDSATYGTGEILVERFIAGNVKTANGAALKSGDRLRLDYAETFACVMGRHRAMENKKGIFLLTLKDNGEIRWEDYRPLETLTELETLLENGNATKPDLKTIKIQNAPEDEVRMVAAKNPNRPVSPVGFGIRSVERKPNFGLIRALFVVFGSLALYYFLYRSRFKIR
jgi:hypothetical protein